MTWMCLECDMLLHLERLNQFPLQILEFTNFEKTSHSILGIPIPKTSRCQVQRYTVVRMILYHTPVKLKFDRELIHQHNQPTLGTSVLLLMSSSEVSPTECLDNATVTLSFTRTSLQECLKLDWLDVGDESGSEFMCGVLS